MKGQVRGFQNPGVCLEAFPSFPSPSLAFLCLALAPFFARVKHRKSRSSVFLFSPTPRKRLLRRIVLSCADKRKFEVSGARNVTGRMKSFFIKLCICIWQGCSPETKLNPWQGPIWVWSDLHHLETELSAFFGISSSATLKDTLAAKNSAVFCHKLSKWDPAESAIYTPKGKTTSIPSIRQKEHFRAQRN